jgi:hypothetical protein
LWIRVLLKTFTKRSRRFVKNPDSHNRDNGFCVWTSTSLVLGLQMGQGIGRCSTTVLCNYGLQYKLRDAGRRLFLSSKLMWLSSIAASDREAPRLIRDGQS